MTKRYFNIDLSKIKNNNPKMNKIGKELFIHWILLNLNKSKRIKISLKDTKVTINLKNILEQKYFEIYRYDIDKNNHLRDLFQQIATIEKNTDVITNNIIYRIFNTIVAQENLGFIRESRYSYDRLSNKIDNLETNNFIENKNSKKDNIKEIIKVYEFIYKNEIHKQILELNSVISKKNIDKTIRLLKTIPFIDDYKAYSILIDLSQYEFYKFDINCFTYLRKEVIFTIKELFDNYDALDFDEIFYWLFFNYEEMIKENYNMVDCKLETYDLEMILYDLSFIIKKIYNDTFDGDDLTNIDMDNISPKNRSKNSEEFNLQIDDGRHLNI